jgi:putative transposase
MQREVNEGLLHHSDKGCQYTSKEFKELIDNHKIQLSMSGTGHCFDNAVAESFFHTLKTEHTTFCNYKIREEAKNSIFEWVEVFYNRRRLHSTIGYLSPEEFERQSEQREEIA